MKNPVSLLLRSRFVAIFSGEGSEPEQKDWK
jgi:hypothetical protein